MQSTSVLLPSATRMFESALPAAMNALTDLTSWTMVTMLLAKRSSRAMMLKARTALRAMNVSDYARQSFPLGEYKDRRLTSFLGRHLELV